MPGLDAEAVRELAVERAKVREAMDRCYQLMLVKVIHKSGASFSGVGAYLLHDKKAETEERVEWTETVNLATNNPKKAVRAMAFVAMDAERLKAQAGVSRRGGHVKGGPRSPLHD